MNDDLQKAVRALRFSVEEKHDVTIFVSEAQALLDERAGLRRICEALQTNGIHVIVNRLRWDDVGYNDLANYLQTISRQAHAALAETRNEKAQP